MLSDSGSKEMRFSFVEMKEKQHDYVYESKTRCLRQPNKSLSLIFNSYTCDRHIVMILKKEVASQRNKNVDILNISSLICHKLSGELRILIRGLTHALTLIIQD